MTINEPAVTLTDYGLTIECAYLTYLLLKEPHSSYPLYRWFIIFFCALALTSFTGGTSHGFFYNESSSLYNAVWNATLISLGAVGAAAYVIASILLLGEKKSNTVIPVIFVAYILYCLYLIKFNNTFFIAIAFYLPASVGLLCAFCWRYIQNKQSYYIWGIIGMCLTFIAAGIQQLGISIHPIWFNHNAVYHLLMAIAIVLLFYTAKGLFQDSTSKLNHR